MGADIKTQDEEQKVFDPANMPHLGNTVPKRYVHVAAWQAGVWVWGTTQVEEIHIADEMQAALAVGGDQAPLKAEARRRVATVLCCARDSDEADAKLLFSQDDWTWLEHQPIAAIDLIVNTVANLNQSTPIAQEELADFFVIASDVVNCLAHIASHCDACTDCPRKSKTTCPLQRYKLLLQPTESSPNGKTDISANGAISESENSSTA